MNLRQLAAADLAAIDADANGPTEALTYAPSNGPIVNLVVVFVDFGRLGTHPVGVGAERHRGEARTRIPTALVPVLDRAAVITRVATGETFEIVDDKLVAGVAWRVYLARRGGLRARGVRG